MDYSGGTPTANKTDLPEPEKNGKIGLTKEIQERCVAACASGFTLEKCAGLIGVPIGTLKTWVNRNPRFGREMESARKNHELSLLRDIELAGQKSWQAKAWLAERIYSHAVPSSRLQVSGSVEHGMSQGFAQLLAGLASRRAEKKAQVIESQEVKALENTEVNTLSTKSKDTNCCATNVDLQQLASHKIGLGRKRRIKIRKPRAESLAKYPPTTTPLPAAPAPVLDAYTPISNSATKQKETDGKASS